VRAGLDLKMAARHRLADLFPEPHAALLQGILLGDDNNIPAELTQSFRATGTTHILAISGQIETQKCRIFRLQS
jgi:competence protein ComEC